MLLIVERMPRPRMGQQPIPVIALLSQSFVQFFRRDQLRFHGAMELFELSQLRRDLKRTAQLRVLVDLGADLGSRQGHVRIQHQAVVGVVPLHAVLTDPAQVVELRQGSQYTFLLGHDQLDVEA